jgi:hypothetical protein
MGWRDQLHKWELADLKALDEKLANGYNEELFLQRHRIVSRGRQRQTIANRKARHKGEVT